MAILIQSIVMLILLVSIFVFMLIKLPGINKYNIFILLILTSFWISSNLLGISIIKQGQTWRWPLIIASSQFTQVAFRLPLGKLSQKIRSRKVPILLTILVMVILSIPLIFTVNYTSLLLAAIGLGFFGASFGMQNQYWSENWNIKRVFITTGMLLSIIFIGKYTSSIISHFIDIKTDNIKWTITTFIIASFVFSCIYIFFHKEKRETIMLDNKSSYAKYVSEMKLKEIMVFSLMITFVSIGMNMINSNMVVGWNSSLELKISLWTATIIVSIFTTFVLVRIIKSRLINIVSHIIMIFGSMLLILSLFFIKSIALSFVALVITTIGTSMFTAFLFGTMLHIDHKNSLLVLGIWLSIKSASIAIGQVIGGEIINAFAFEGAKYMTITMMGLVAISFTFSLMVYDKVTKPAFDLIDQMDYVPYKEWLFNKK